MAQNDGIIIAKDSASKHMEDDKFYQKTGGLNTEIELAY